MSHVTLWLHAGFVGEVGWSLIHFLWEGAVLAGLLYLVLPMCRSAATRHDLALGTLVTMGLAPAVTFLMLHKQPQSSAALVAASGLFSQGMASGGKAAAAMLRPDLLMWLVALWLAGVAALSLRAVGGWLLAETWRRVDTIAPPEELQRRCLELQRRLALSQPVKFLQSRRAGTPMVIGWFKPVVLIPVSAVAGLPVEQLDALILHELAHIVRLDAFANVVQVAVETILFYHPAVWWVSRRVRAEREHCCDDVAVSACGDVSTYVEALLSLETSRAAPNLGLAAGGGKLKARVMRLLDKPAEARRSFSSALVGMALLSLVFACVATAQTAAPAGHQAVSFRVVDEMPGAGMSAVPPGDDRVVLSKPGMGQPKFLLLKRDGQISGDVLSEAHVAKGVDGEPIIRFTFTPEAAAKFAKLTRDNVGRRLAVVAKDRIIMAPLLKEPILGTGGEIAGNFASKAEAEAWIADMMGNR